MARDPEIERRLYNWARAKAGGLSGGLGYAKVDLQTEGDSQRYREATIPIDACDADVTDQAVKALAPVLRETVQQLYLRNLSMREVAARARIGEPAARARLWKAHAELRTWFAERERKAADERARVQRLQRASAAPRGF